MTHYIDKDRIVAEIEKIIADETESIKSFEHGKNVSEVQRSNARIGILIHIRSLLDTLEDEKSTHRTPADIESAMQEVEAKSEAYTNAHRGERDDDVLSQMRGEPVSEEIWEASKQYALRQVLASTDTEMSEQAYLDLRLFSGFELAVAHKDGAKWKEEQFEKNRLKHCNSITNEQAELEQKFLDEHLDKHNRMPTFLDAIEYGMELKNRAKSHKGKGAECAECADYWKKKGIEIGKKSRDGKK